MKRCSLMGLLAAAALLGACAQTIKSDVTRFHQSAVPTSGTVAIVAIDERKSGSLAFSQQAADVMDHLVREGFTPAREGVPPDYIAQLDFYQRPLANDFDRNGSSVSVGVGGGSGGYHSGGVGVGIGTSFDLGGSGSQSANRLVVLWMDQVSSGERVFEARVQSLGPADNFQNALPYMIDALFDGFPGQNGTTITVEREIK